MPNEIELDFENQAFTVENNLKESIIVLQLKTSMDMAELEALQKIIFVNFKNKTYQRLIVDLN